MRAAAVVALCPLAAAEFPAPRHTVSLDDPPGERWKPLFADTARRHGGWEYTGKPAFDFLNQFGDADFWHKWNSTLTAVGFHVLGEESVLEARSLVEFANQPQFAANITLGASCFFQMFYELAMQCTGILGHNSEGGMVHGRNLDIGLQVTNLTYQVDWTKGGKTILTTTQFLGYSGIHTGMRHDGWSVQANERVVLVPGPWVGYEKSIAADTVAHFALGARPVGLYLRDALLSSATLADALPALETTPLASPMYIIAGGAASGDGTVLTRGRKGLAKVNNFGWPIEAAHETNGPVWTFAGAADAAGGQPPLWHVHTNWDYWMNETEAQCKVNMAARSAEAEALCEKFISTVYADKGKCEELCRLYSDGRREAGIQYMTEAVGGAGKVTYDMVYAAMSRAPVLNGGTMFTSVMSAATNYYNTTVRGFGGNGDVTPALIDAGRVLLKGLLEMKL